jgi:hypothetical protein
MSIKTDLKTIVGGIKPENNTKESTAKFVRQLLVRVIYQ